MVASTLITIVILNKKHSTSKLFCVLGLVTGLALLTKFTAVIILPVIFLILLYKLLYEERCPLVRLGGYLGLTALLIVTVAAWFYARNWIHFGKVFIGNWDPSSGFHWWQDPGFHTYKYFCRFGKVFCLPYFAGFYSLFDSLYSTFWGDGFLGGTTAYAYRPPWNYEYMSAVYLLSIPASLFIIIGTLLAIGKVVSQVNKFWLLILGLVFVVIHSLVYMSFRIPYYAQAKAFYGLFVILPVSLIFALGFDYVDRWLRDKNLSLVRALLYGWFGMLALAIFSCFFVRPAQVHKELNLSALAKQGKLDQAIAHYTQVLHDDSDNHDGHYNLATAYALQGKNSNAAEHYKKALELRPDWPATLNGLSYMLHKKPYPTGSDINQAIRYAKRSCELTGYLQAEPLCSLIDAYAVAGRFEEAIETAEKAINVAKTAGQKDLVQQIQRRLRLYKAKQPYYERNIDKAGQ
jgi:hypothetical protein